MSVFYMRCVSCGFVCIYLLALSYVFAVFFFNDTATTEIYTYLHTLSLHDALPICRVAGRLLADDLRVQFGDLLGGIVERADIGLQVLLRSEEHTSELQSLMRISYAVFCLKKKNKPFTARRQHVTSTYQP